MTLLKIQRKSKEKNVFNMYVEYINEKSSIYTKIASTEDNVKNDSF